jgi:hypothetical protein
MNDVSFKSRTSTAAAASAYACGVERMPSLLSSASLRRPIAATRPRPGSGGYRVPRDSHVPEPSDEAERFLLGDASRLITVRNDPFEALLEKSRCHFAQDVRRLRETLRDQLVALGGMQDALDDYLCQALAQ